MTCNSKEIIIVKMLNGSKKADSVQMIKIIFAIIRRVIFRVKFR